LQGPANIFSLKCIWS